MKSNYKLIVLIPICLCAMGSAHAAGQAPTNYDECLLDNVHLMTPKHAVGVVQSACRSKFPQACIAWLEWAIANSKAELAAERAERAGAGIWPRYSTSLILHPAPVGCPQPGD